MFVNLKESFFFQQILLLQFLDILFRIFVYRFFDVIFQTKIRQRYRNPTVFPLFDFINFQISKFKESIN